ncbi:MAG: hypothetical protein WBA44_17065 [Mesorhizobium sp.]
MPNDNIARMIFIVCTFEHLFENRALNAIEICHIDGKEAALGGANAQDQ